MTSVLDMEAGDAFAQVRRGFDWWIGQLAEIAAPLLRQRGARGGETLARPLAAGGYELWRGGAPVGRAERARPVAAAVVLPPSACLVREVATPGLSEGDWRRILAGDVDRLSPFAAADVYLAVRFGRSADGARRAEVGFAPRARAEAALRAALAAGVRPVALVAEAVDGAPLDFLPAVRAAGGVRADTRARTLWALAAVLLVANIALAVWRDVAATDRLQAQVAEVEPTADRLAHMKRALDGETARRRELTALRTDRSPLELLDRTARALPDGAFLQRLAYENGVVRLSGLEGGGADAAAAFRAAPGFAKVRDATLDLGETAPGTQRPFDLTAETPPQAGARP